LWPSAPSALQTDCCWSLWCQPVLAAYCVPARDTHKQEVHSFLWPDGVDFSKS
jgi:hypothetical protein